MENDHQKLRSHGRELGFVVVHLGAGYHSKSKLGQYKAVCSNACRSGIKLCKSGHLASHIACKVLSILEDSELTNAGIGSNLTRDGTIECDAGLMDSLSGNFAAVGCIKGIRNPIEVAYELHKNQEKDHDGLVPPMILVGEGAKKFALENGIEGMCIKEMITESSISCYNKAMTRMRKNKAARTLCRKDEKDSSVHETIADEDNKDMFKLENKNGDQYFNDKISTAFPVIGKSPETVHVDSVGVNEANPVVSKRKISSSFKDCCDQNISGKKIFKNVDNKTGTSFVATGNDVKMTEESGCDWSLLNKDSTSFIISENLSDVTTQKSSKKEVNYDAMMMEKLDTVGVICVDRYGNVCSAVSSGGLILKASGRIGQAACYGCGCFVAEKIDASEHSIAASSASGCGEQLIKTLLAKHCVDTMLSDDESVILDPSRLLDGGFLRSNYLKNESNKLAGSINVKLTRCDGESEEEIDLESNLKLPGSSVEPISNPGLDKINPEEPGGKTASAKYYLNLLFACTTRSFCVGFMSSLEKKPRCVLLEMPESKTVGNAVVSQEFHFKW